MAHIRQARSEFQTTHERVAADAGAGRGPSLTLTMRRESGGDNGSTHAVLAGWEQGQGNDWPWRKREDDQSSLLYVGLRLDD